VSAVGLAGRGRRLDAMLEEIGAIWSAGEIGPRSAGRPGLVLGGHAEASFARAARFGDGWIAAGSGPDQYAEGAAKAREAWSRAGRDGAPRLMALAYFSLGDNAAAEANAYLGDYYAWLGDEIAGYIVGGAAKDAETVRSHIATYEAA